MVSEFIKGVGLGIIEGAAETIDADMKRLRATQDAMINHHMTRGLKEQERHDKQQQEVAEALELLKSITGEPNSDLAYEQAAQLFNAVGKDVTQAKELFKTVQNAQAMNPDYKVNEAFSFITPEQDLRTKKEIIESFATGQKGVYDPQVTTVQVPGILGMITKEKDVSKQVRANLSTLGIPSQQSASDAAPTLGQATIKRAYLDPVAKLEYDKAGIDVKTAQENLTNLKILNKRDQALLDNLPEKTRLELKNKRIQINNAIKAGKQADFDFMMSQKYGVKEKELNIRLIEARILAQGPKDLEEYSVQLMSQIDVLNKRLADTGNNPTERQRINEGIGVYSESLARVTKSMSEEAKLRFRDTVNPVSMYNNFFNVALSARGVDYEYQNIDGIIKAKVDGVSVEKYLARLDAATSMFNVFGPSPLATEYAQQAQQELNTLLPDKTADALSNGKIVVAPLQINLKTKLTPGVIYDVSRSQLVFPKNEKGEVERKSVVNSLQERGYKLISGKYAIWIGDDFRAIR